MSAPQKLTKRKQKALAFYRNSRSKSNGSAPALEDNSVPVLEVQAEGTLEPHSPSLEVEAEQRPLLADARKTARKGKAKDAGDGAVDAAPKTKKRKRESVAGASQEDPEPKTKKTKRAGKDEDGAAEQNAKGQVKQRYILFVGNLKYTTTAEAIKEHFSACDPPPTVRLRTPKPSASGKPVIKSKGCAFVEFSHRNALQQGLKLHQSELEGRRINVELTVGGGGKSETRLQKLKDRNKSLHGERKDRQEKMAKADPSVLLVPERPQRFSATSGLDSTVAKRRTWTVGDAVDDETHRGGKKHKKTRGKGGKQWGTGVNAIPVG
ncbi:RRM domain-containing protein [Mycena kentingensis (nom. inval.)]|nr:RRM domain-containing protein [Mycena kentingensis (nom. inval.)]